MDCKKCGGSMRVKRTTQNWHGGGTHRSFVCARCGMKFETIEVNRATDERVGKEARKLREKLLGHPLPVL